MSKKQTALETACDKKLNEIAKEISKTNCSSERIKVLADNAEYLKKVKKKDPKGFKAWISKIEAGDVLKAVFSTGMFALILYGEEIGRLVRSGATNFIPWNKTPKF